MAKKKSAPKPLKLPELEGVDPLYLTNPNMALRKAKDDYLAEVRSLNEISEYYGIPFHTVSQHAYYRKDAWVKHKDEAKARIAAEEKKYIKALVAKDLFGMKQVKTLCLDLCIRYLTQLHGDPSVKINSRTFDVIAALLEKSDKMNRLDDNQATHIVGNKEIEVTNDDVMKALRELSDLDKDVMEGESGTNKEPTTH